MLLQALTFIPAARNRTCAAQLTKKTSSFLLTCPNSYFLCY
jgi:hypothetical protein